DREYKGLFVQAVVLDPDQFIQGKEMILETFSIINILHNVTEGNLSEAIVTPQNRIFDLDMTEFEKVVDLNLSDTVLPTKIFCTEMAQRGQGVIVNIASMSSFRPITRVVGYSAAKSAVKNFTEWLAIEMAKKFGEGI